MDQTKIYLKQSLKVIVSQGKEDKKQEVSTIAKNLVSLGFGLSGPLLERLATLDHHALKVWYEEILPTLQEMVGAHRKYKPMYPNFPKQVMELSDSELFFNAMANYYGFWLSDQLNDPNLVILPNYEKETRPLLDEFNELRWIELGSDDDFNLIFTRLASSNGSLSEFDKETLRWFAKNKEVEGLIPSVIPQKETLAFLVATLPNPDCLISSIKTATDVLRIAAVMSEGDVSLAEPTKYRSFKKSERRFLLGCLENCGANRTEDMLRWKSRWKRLGEKLHPGDFKDKFPESFASFNVLRNNEPFRTFNSYVEEAIVDGGASEISSLLSQRPGDFARRLDHVLRSSNDYGKILETFSGVSEKVSTPVLLQVWKHFVNRDKIKGRAFFPKGNLAKIQYMEGVMPSLPTEVSDTTASVLRNALLKRFSNLPPMGKVYLDERLKDQIVPFSQRSASESLQTVARGSSFDLPEGNTVRFFCWWKNIENTGDDDDDYGNGRVDIDLSVAFFTSYWEHKGGISYYNLREGDCVHSGDITSAPKGACEFVDINLETIGCRYIMMSLNSFTQQPFCKIPECFGGWMMRQKPKSGEIFEARTVQEKVNIVSATTISVPVIIDTVDRKVYWVDLGLPNNWGINNIRSCSDSLSKIGQAMVELNKPSLHDLFSMHIESRGGEKVGNREEADVVFDLYKGDVTAYDGSTILSEYLA